MFDQLGMLTLYVEGLLQDRTRMRREEGDRGDIVQNVIWIALFAAAAIAIATIIIVKFTGKAQSIPTG
jgi:hypothetical protein